MKVVLDTNTLISAAIAKGKPHKLLIKGISDEFTIVTSKPLLKELEEVIDRPKFKLSMAEKGKFISTVKGTVELTEIKSDFNAVKDDPDDNVIINTAYDGKANYIVSGDRDLLKLKEFEGIKVVTVSEMLKILKSE